MAPPGDQAAAVALAADAAKRFAEGLRGVVAKASAEAQEESRQLDGQRQQLAERRRELEQGRRRLEGELRGLEEERARFSGERSRFEAERGGLQRERQRLEGLREGLVGERADLGKERAVLTKERAMFEQEISNFNRERTEFGRQRDGLPPSPAPAAAAGAAAQGPRAEGTVSLALGGEANVTVLLSTLLQAPECRFTRLFSQPSSAPRDGEGRIFVDFPPALFMPLLEHLRMRRIEEPGELTPPPGFASRELEAQFGKMLQHYGLKDWVYRPGSAPPAAAPAPAAAAPVAAPAAEEEAEPPAPPPPAVASRAAAPQRPPASPSRPASAAGERPSPGPKPGQAPAAAPAQRQAVAGAASPGQRQAAAAAASPGRRPGAAAASPKPAAATASPKPVAAAASPGGRQVAAAASPGGRPVAAAASPKPVAAAASPGGKPVAAAASPGGKPLAAAASPGGKPVAAAASPGGKPVGAVAAVSSQPAEAAAGLKEAARVVAEAEDRVRQALAASAPLAPERAQRAGLEQLKAASEQTLKAEKAAALACAEAKKALAARLREPLAAEAAELARLQERLAAAQLELGKLRKVAVQGEKLWKGRLALSSRAEDVRQLEAEVDKVRGQLLHPGGQAPADQEAGAAVDALQAKLAEVKASLESCGQVSGRSQLDPLLVQVKQVQKKLDGLKAVAKAQREKGLCDAVLRDARARLAKLDAALRQLAAAPAASTERQALAGVVEKAVAEARALVDARLPDVKQLTGVIAQAGSKELEALAKRSAEALEEAAKVKKDTEARKRNALQQEVLKLVTTAEEAAEEATRAAAPLSAEGGEALPAEEAKEVCERVLAAEGQAAGRLEAAKQFLSGHLGLPELSKLLGRLNAVQVELAKAKASASEYEHRVAAKKLKQEASEMVSSLESDFERAKEAAEPLLADRGRGIAAAGLAGKAAEAIKERARASSLSWEALFERLGPEATAGKATQNEFSDFLGQLPEPLTPEQRALVFERADADKDGALSKADFLSLLRERCVCVKEIAITKAYEISVRELTAGSTLGKLQVGDTVEIAVEPKRNASTGIVRAQVTVRNSGAKGWVTVKGNQSTEYLARIGPQEALLADLDAALGVAQAAAAKAFDFVGAKGAELQDCRKGPLLEAKAELAKARPKVSVVQAKLEQLKKRVEEVRKELARKEEAQRKELEERKEQQAASEALEEASKDMNDVQKALEELRAAAAPLTSVAEQELSSVERPLTARGAAKAAGDALAAAAARAKGRLAALGGGAKGAEEARRRLEAAEREAVALAGKVQSACCALAAARLDQACVAFRGAMDARGLSAEALFTELAGSEGKITEQAFFERLERLEGISLSAEQRRMLFQNGDAGGMSRRSFFSMLERYYKCVKDIVLTSDFDIKKGDVLRKLEVGERVELLEGPRGDEALGVVRLRARALSDGMVGWITARGNQGTPYLQEAPKPCYFATREVVMEDDYASEGSKPVRSLRPGEVVEVLEGPRKEALGHALRARGRALSDGAVGWFTTRNKQGDECVETGKPTYKCLAGIALTDAMDIKKCNPLRKLEPGELLVLLEGPAEDAAAGVSRLRVQALKDGARGWTTCRGSAGKVFVEESGRQTVVARAMPLQAGFAGDSAVVRTLRELEFVELLEGPREDRSEAGLRVRGCAVADGRVGWLTVRWGNLEPWSPNYRCAQPTPLHDSHLVSGARPVRELAIGEMVELLEGPRVDAIRGVLRMKGRAEKDGAVGWASINDAEGKPLLECIAAR